MTPDLDTSLLRTIVALVDGGGIEEAARRVGRSPSAVSLQVKRLEQRLGTPLFDRGGRRLLPTRRGLVLIEYARRILRLNDEAVREVAEPGLSRVLRVAMPQDYAESWLPGFLRGFAAGHPEIDLRISVGGGRNALDALARDEVDVAMALGLPLTERAIAVAEVPLRWLAADGGGPAGGAVPIVAFPPPCRFRDRGLAALERAGRAWKVVFTSPSLGGVRAAVRAGLGVTVRTAEGVDDGLIDAGAAWDLPALGTVTLAIYPGATARTGPAGRFVDAAVAGLRATAFRSPAPTAPGNPRRG